MRVNDMEKVWKPVPDVEELKYHGTPEKPDIKIFVSHRIDLDSETIDNPLYIPVRCGAVYDERENVTMLGDDTGDNISEKRMSYCELTVQYWAWKNIKADYYGLCHYRRYFSFSNTKLFEDVYGAVNFDRLDAKAKNQMCLLDDDLILNEIKDYDFIISTPANLKKVGIKTVKEQYDKIPELNIEDLEKAVDIIKRKYPDYFQYVDEYIYGSLLYPCNMFIMKKELFFEYCEWLFSILEELEYSIDVSNYSVEGMRTVGHIAERLLGVFYIYCKEKKKRLKYKILQRSIIWNSEILQFPKPFFPENNVAIVFSFSDFFVPYAAVTLSSLVENASQNKNYDIVVFCTYISNRNKNYLNKIFLNRKNFSLRFFNISSYVEGLNLKANNHVSVETFYRLLVNQIMENYDKILYLDSDIIINRDPSELYEIDITDYYAAATLDPDHAGEYHAAIPSVRKYTDSVLKLKDPYSYFQAGVILFNIANINCNFKKNELINFAEKREYMYVDQDVLNIMFEGKVKIIDQRWNVMTDCNEIRVNEIIKKAPYHIYYAYMESRKDPFIIHYAGNEKPWNSPVSDMADAYWNYARKTTFYEANLWRLADSVFNCHSFNKRTIFSRICNALFPKSTRRREQLKKIYFKLVKHG